MEPDRAPLAQALSASTRLVRSGRASRSVRRAETHARTHARTHGAHAQARAHGSTHTRARTRARAHTHTHARTRTHTHQVRYFIQRQRLRPVESASAPQARFVAFYCVLLRLIAASRICLGPAKIAWAQSDRPGPLHRVAACCVLFSGLAASNGSLIFRLLLRLIASYYVLLSLIASYYGSLVFRLVAPAAARRRWDRRSRLVAPYCALLRLLHLLHLIASFCVLLRLIAAALQGRDRPPLPPLQSRVTRGKRTQ